MEIIPLKKPPGKAEAQQTIRMMVAEGRVSFHPHSRRGKRGKISTVQVLNCLSKGRVDEEPTQNLSHKGWQTAVVGNTAGNYLRVVVCLRWSQDILIISNYYED